MSREPVPAIKPGEDSPRVVMLVRSDIAMSYGNPLKDPLCRGGVLRHGKRYFAYWKEGGIFANPGASKYPRGAYVVEARAEDSPLCRQVDLEGSRIALGIVPWKDPE